MSTADRPTTEPRRYKRIDQGSIEVCWACDHQMKDGNCPIHGDLTKRAEAARGAAPLDLLREIAASGVVHEAEPPGIDYVTVQVDMDTWAQLRAWSEGAAPRAEGLDVERLRIAVMEGTDPDTGDVWLHREDADILRARLSRPSDEREPGASDD